MYLFMKLKHFDKDGLARYRHLHLPLRLETRRIVPYHMIWGRQRVLFALTPSLLFVFRLSSHEIINGSFPIFKP